MARLPDILRSPFAFLFARPQAEELVAEYVDPRAPQRPVARRHPRRPLRQEPLHARAGAACARPARGRTRGRRRHRSPRASCSRARPTPRSRASSTTRAPTARSQAAIPFDLKTTTSLVRRATLDARRRRPPAARAPRASRGRRARPARSGRRTRVCDCSRESQQTNAARSSTALSSSRRVGSFAPTAQTSAPGRSHSPRSTGSFEVVTVTTTSCSAASRCDSAGSQSCSRQNAASRSAFRQ